MSVDAVGSSLNEDQVEDVRERLATALADVRRDIERISPDLVVDLTVEP